MQDSDDKPRGAGRPSLLTAAQQAEADRNRILSNLEGGAAAPKAAPRRPAVLWGGLGAGALALIAGAAWMYDGAPPEARPSSSPVAVAVTPVLSAAAPAATPAATINDIGAALEAPPKQESLKDMLSAAPPAKPARAVDVLNKALESPPTAQERAAASAAADQKLAQARIERKRAAAAVKARAHEKKLAQEHAKLSKEQAKAKAKAAATAKAGARVKKKVDNDSDVTLLAALVAHAQEHPEPARKPGGEAQIKQCVQAGKGDAESCRTRVCGGRGASDAACKTAPR
ncbi:hypothetical protein [Janthinobacterium sp.]|uniref:hypothetical protein n=1 Tax=Janthinobacterium sp. TaxID=1871054 RepID=UPI00293D9CE8|nr:hypothetical protein [Janthinobacterium sp.]